MVTDNITFTNFRDMGTLVCEDGKKIRPGKLFRAPKLVPASQADRDYLESLGLECVVDLRCTEETQQNPDELPKKCEYISAPVFSGEKYRYIIVTYMAKLRCILLRGKRIEKLKKNKTDSYAEMPFSPAYKRIFECMDKGKTIAFHCTEGKDRTGIAALLIEFAFGRSESEIRQQYLYSNVLRPNKDRSALKYLGTPKKLIDTISYCEQTHNELFDIALHAILSKYSSIGEYLEKQFGVTNERIEKWKNLYLE